MTALLVCDQCHEITPCWCAGERAAEPRPADDARPVLVERPRRAIRRVVPIEAVQRPVVARGTTTRHHRTPIEDVYVGASELRALLPELLALIPDTAAPLETEISPSGKRVAAPIPWNDAAALTYFTIHGDVRRYESLLTLRLYGRAKYRAATDAETVAILEGLPVLVAHGRDAGLDDLDLDDVTRDLVTWPRQVRVLLGRPLPGDASRTPVPGRPACPHCGRTLVLSAGWKVLETESVQALCTWCRDDAGKPLAWPVTEWVGHLQAEELVTGEDARARYGVGSSTLRSWKHRGRIHHYGQDDRGRHLYRVADITALLDQHETTPTNATAHRPTENDPNPEG